MTSIEITNPAYERIVNSDLNQQIIAKKETIDKILLYRDIFAENGEKDQSLIIQEWLRDGGILTPEKRDIVEIIYEFNNWNSYEILDVEKLLINHPHYLTRIILENKNSDFEIYGFPSERVMAQAITAFCIGERYALRNRLYDRDKTWRTGNFKNRISGNEHGDLFVGQMETSAKTKTTTENTLFGKITTTNFEPYKEAERKGFCEYQDWSGYLLSLLKFAEAIGKRNLPEIINWKEILKARGGGTGTATTESMFGSNTAKSDAEIYLNFSIVQKNIIPQTLPLGIPYYHQGTTLPFMDDNRLLYLRENKEGEIVLNNLGALSKNKKYSIVVEYTPEDLPPALEATYIHFARDRMLMHEIMKQFNNEKEE